MLSTVHTGGYLLGAIEVMNRVNRRLWKGYTGGYEQSTLEVIIFTGGYQQRSLEIMNRVHRRLWTGYTGGYEQSTLEFIYGGTLDVIKGVHWRL